MCKLNAKSRAKFASVNTPLLYLVTFWSPSLMWRLIKVCPFFPLEHKSLLEGAFHPRRGGTTLILVVLAPYLSESLL